MPAPAITPLPTPPNRSQPTTFSERTDNILAALPVFQTQMNAFAAYMDNLALATGPGLFLDGSESAPGISFANDTDTGFFRTGGNNFAIATNGIECLRITNVGTFRFGDSGDILGLTNYRQHIHSLAGPASSIGLISYNVGAAVAPTIAFAKTRGAAMQDYAIVNLNDTLGKIDFRGADGSTTVLSSRILSQVTGTPAAGDVRGNLIFQVGDGAGTVATEMTITDTAITSVVPVLGPVGSITAPTFSFSATTNLGFFRQGAAAIGVTVSGTERIRFEATAISVIQAGAILRLGGVAAANQVLTVRQTGWTAPTGTATRTTFDTATVTLPQLAERFKALIDNLLTHGMIGA